LNDVAVILHTPNRPQLLRTLPMLVAERPDVFQAYQSVHSDHEGATLKKRSLALTFVAVGAGQMLFSGLFRITGFSGWPLKKIDNDPNFRALVQDYGDGWASDYARSKGESHRLVFDMEPDERLVEYVGRLRIEKPVGRRLIRKAENLRAEILALHQHSQLIEPAPDWRGMILSGPEVRALPASWAARLREWRGIYLIVDETDGARYVGSACGAENLLGRWRAHVAGDLGVTKELSLRAPEDFRFSILQLLAPDADPSDVIRTEHSWMDRLHTREHGLNT